MKKDNYKKTFKLAMIQILVEGSLKEKNISHAEELIKEASEAGVQIALLPECLDLGWPHPSSQTEAEPIPEGDPYKRLAKAALENNIYICAGLTEKVPEKIQVKKHRKTLEKIYNTAVLIDNKGELKLIHRKLNELDIGHDYYNLGDRLNVVETEFGVIGLMICADAFAKDQVISRFLCYMGADITSEVQPFCGHDWSKTES